jgi:D-tyrosyl-tRNA(Tyr) deacylase
VDGNLEKAAIGLGLLVLLGVERGDGDDQARYLARKIAEVRIFPDEQGKMNRSVREVGGSALVVSQFTLCADLRRGRRPGFDRALPPPEAEILYQRFADLLRAGGLTVKTGLFGAHMDVSLVNDGPVTLVYDHGPAEAASSP